MSKAKKSSQLTPSLDREMSFNRFRDTLVILPWLALILMLSPVLNFIEADVMLWGIPARIIQLLGAWIGLIILVYCLNRGLRLAIESRAP